MSHQPRCKSWVQSNISCFLSSFLNSFYNCRFLDFWMCSCGQATCGSCTKKLTTSRPKRRTRQMVLTPWELLEVYGDRNIQREFGSNWRRCMSIVGYSEVPSYGFLFAKLRFKHLTFFVCVCFFLHLFVVLFCFSSLAFWLFFIQLIFIIAIH